MKISTGMSDHFTDSPKIAAEFWPEVTFFAVLSCQGGLGFAQISLICEYYTNTFPIRCIFSLTPFYWLAWNRVLTRRNIFAFLRSFFVKVALVLPKLVDFCSLKNLPSFILLRVSRVNCSLIFVKFIWILFADPEAQAYTQTYLARGKYFDHQRNHFPKLNNCL